MGGETVGRRLAERWRQYVMFAPLRGRGPGSAVARRVVPWAGLFVAGAVGGAYALVGSGRLGLATGLLLLGLLLLVALLAVALWAAASLNATAAENRRFFELSQDLLAVADFSGHFVELNPQWEAVLGWTRDELLRTPFIDLVHPDDVAATLAEYQRANAGQVVLRFTNRYRTKAGGYRWLEWCATTVPALGLGYSVARDVTELRALERDLRTSVAELHAANQELESFSYSVSHDLRAPLRHITAFTTLLRDQAGPTLTEEAHRWLGIIHGSTTRMSQLIDDLLAFSRIGRAPLAARPVDLTPLVAEVWEETRNEAGQRRVEWRLGELPAVWGDPGLLRVAFANLLSNALKYSSRREPAVISVTGERRGDDAVIAVRDNGVGFDMRYADKLFGVFQRLHAPEEFEGTGIGLATVKRVVTRHGGRVEAEGMPGVGATFCVVLPAADVTAESRVPAALGVAAP
jgi:PAS domain S-box-containing protein